MAKAIGDFFDENEVGDGGSDYGYWRLVDDAEGTTTDEWSEMPLREKYDMPNNSSTNTKTSEGKVERTTGAKKKFDMTLTFQHFGDDVYDTIPDALEGNIVEVLLERNMDPINGKKSFLHVFGKLTKSPTPGADKSAEYELSLLACTKTGDYSLTINETTFPNFTGIGATGGALVHKKNRYFALHSLAYT